MILILSIKAVHFWRTRSMHYVYYLIIMIKRIWYLFFNVKNRNFIVYNNDFSFTNIESNSLMFADNF